MRKFIVIAAFIMLVSAIGVLLIINNIFNRGVSSSLPRVLEKPAVEEARPLSYATSVEPAVIPQETKEHMDKIAEKRNVFKKLELEAQRARDARREEILSQLKAREASLMRIEAQNAKKGIPSEKLPQADTETLVEEKLKEMESKGIIAY